MTDKQYLNVAESAKAYVAGVAALIGTVATALLAVYADNPILTAVGIVATSVAAFVSTFKIPNATPASEVVAPVDEPDFL